MKTMPTLSLRLLVAWSRSAQTLRWPGLAGLGLCLMAAATFWFAHAMQSEADMMRTQLPLVPKVIAGGAAARFTQPSAPPLPSEHEALAILAKLQHSVQANGLGWSLATYQYGSVSSEALASMEIQTTLKGSYLNIKKTLSALLDEYPAMGLRELSFTRVNVDMSEVEAKVRLVVFLSDGWYPDQAEAAR